MTDAPLGRTTITARALTSVVAAVAADALGVPARQVSSDIRDDEGMLALAVRAPVRVPSLAAVAADAAVVARLGGTLVERTASAQQTIHARVEALTGSSVSRLDVRLTGVDIMPTSRIDRPEGRRLR